MYVPFFRSGRSQNSYLRLCAFLRFFRDFFLLGVCKVDQQNACTSKIPIIAPQLSIPTSLTEGPRGPLQKTDGIHPVQQIPHIQIRRGASARFPELRIHRGVRKQIWPAGSILSCEQPYGHKIRYRQLPGKAVPGFCRKLIFHFLFLRSDS